ncbi:hypothetical protein [Anaplasma platys]|nr:hypothetical protein [Anaplasma platys]
MSENDEYKEIIRQCIGSVKEVFGDGKFDDVVASIMKMQEKVLASGLQGSGEVAGQLAADDKDAQQAHDGGWADELREEFREELRAVKRRILKLERAVYGAPGGGSSVPSSAAQSSKGGEA